MRRRQWLTAILACGLLAVGFACGGDDDGEEAGGGATTTEETASGEGTRVGLVSDVGRFNDRSFNQSALEGLQRGEDELGITGRPVESRQTSDYVPNLGSLAREGFDLTIGVGFLLAEALNTAAKRYTDSNFAIIDYSVNAPPFAKNPNVQGLTFATNENSYMIGCLAALMAQKQGGRQVISAVGGAGGCGLGALDAAKQRDKWGIGVDRDQSSLGPHILTSAVKRVDQSVFLASKSVVDGEFKGGTDAVFDLENEGVAIGKISPEVPQEFIDRMNEIKEQLISGELEAPSTL
ncbi:MAG: family transporter substrate-binding protein [Gaiellaceae bacterium]|nr:family transporter substrate-binding protein [Gaiellaceae bacterium]